VLPVAAHRWVLTDNTFWHARWDPIDYFINPIDYFVDFIDYFVVYVDCSLNTSITSTTIGYIVFFGFIDFCCQDARREPDHF
jgi:hypothetical protein